MKTSASATRAPEAVDPKAFRAKATGIGHSQGVSLVSGNMRAQHIVDTTEPQRSTVGKAPPRAGFPKPLATFGGPLVKGRAGLGRPY